jgi:hypothetical protein
MNAISLARVIAFPLVGESETMNGVEHRQSCCKLDINPKTIKQGIDK